MKQGQWRYIVGFIMMAYGGFQISVRDYWESSLYISAGLAFITMALIQGDVFPGHRKLMTALSWILIIAAGFLLLFLARTDK